MRTCTSQRGCIVALLVLASACAHEDVAHTEAPIIDGTPTTDFGWVGFVTRGSMSCTGSLIAPNWALTTASCVGDADPTELRFLREPVAGASSSSAVIAAIHPHPAYVPPGVGGAENDLALLQLVAEDSTDAPPLNALNLFAMEGLPFTWIGYGADASDGSGIGTRRTGAGEIADVQATYWIAFAVAGVSPCDGDLGSPVVANVGGDEHIIGVVGAWEEGCVDLSTAWRMDIYIDWIDATLDTPLDTCSPLGGDCEVGSCLPVDETTSVCHPSDARGEGASCDPAAPVWGDGVPCDDGLLCAETGDGGRCVSLCMNDDDCDTGESCETGALAVRADLGVCAAPVPADAGTDDAGTDAGIDGGADLDSGGADAGVDAGSGGGGGCRTARGGEGFTLLLLALLFRRRRQVT